MTDILTDQMLDAPYWHSVHVGGGQYAPRYRGYSMREVLILGEDPDPIALQHLRLARRLQSAGIPLEPADES